MLQIFLLVGINSLLKEFISQHFKEYHDMIRREDKFKLKT